jgi:hypothetical protein
VLEKTDQQRREQRQEERQAARQAAGPAPGAASTLPRGIDLSIAIAITGRTGPESARIEKRRRWPACSTYWAQIVICFLLGTVFQARLITLIGIVLVVILRYRRIQRWDVWRSDGRLCWSAWDCGFRSDQRNALRSARKRRGEVPTALRNMVTKAALSSQGIGHGLMRSPGTAAAAR